MQTDFKSVPVGGTFRFGEHQFCKVAMSCAEGEDGQANVFRNNAVVEFLAEVPLRTVETPSKFVPLDDAQLD